MEISPQLALTLVERLLGGSSETVRKARSITPIEQAVIRGMIEHAFSDLTTAWRSIAELSFRYSRLETEADFVQIAPSSEIVVVVSFDVNVGMNQYLMNLCFPTFALEDVLTQLNRQQLTTSAKYTNERQKENMQILRQQLSHTYLPVQALLGKASIGVGELLELKVGDILKLNTRINQEIEVIIAGRRKLAARPGAVDGKKSVKITRNLQQDDLVDIDTLYKRKGE